eukprot:CAMPEP_0197251398 /NCGR_PEP_ID=MMETSP1429-20130617/57058_1 /TAXON_ID=49237 /ORGANISM="Chaetoceros  sp., Strain UNC1202" /LENGTH=57 /DNA_ID=CAMNT_0042713473 /DNA_START=118 /DNA_END=291 /DNA_ORIENTATION=-
MGSTNRHSRQPRPVLDQLERNQGGYMRQTSPELLGSMSHPAAALGALHLFLDQAALT